MKMFLLVLVAFLIWQSDARPKGEVESDVEPEEDKSQCVKELVEWCKNKDYQNTTGVSVISNVDYKNGIRNDIYCTQDSTGTVCTNNRSPYFGCYPNQTVTYKGNPLDGNSDSVDEGICSFKNQVTSWFDTKQFRHGMEEFEKGMKRFRETMDDFRRRMTSMFSSGFPFNEYNDDNDDNDSD